MLKCWTSLYTNLKISASAFISGYSHRSLFPIKNKNCYNCFGLSFLCSFIQLDLGQLQVTNKFSWHGCRESDASAVHIDVLHAEVELFMDLFKIPARICGNHYFINVQLQLLGVNMLVGINGCLGKPMIQESQGLEVYVRRSLRDVFRKVPTFSLEVVVIYFIKAF